MYPPLDPKYGADHKQATKAFWRAVQALAKLNMEAIDDGGHIVDGPHNHNWQTKEKFCDCRKSVRINLDYGPIVSNDSHQPPGESWEQLSDPQDEIGNDTEDGLYYYFPINIALDATPWVDAYKAVYEPYPGRDGALEFMLSVEHQRIMKQLEEEYCAEKEVEYQQQLQQQSQQQRQH